MIQKINLKGKLTAGTVFLILLLILFVSIQTAYYQDIPNRKDYYFSMDISDEYHNYSRTEEIYELFLEADDWDVSYHDSNYRWVRVNETRGVFETRMSIRIDNNRTLIMIGDRVVSYDTKGPPIHPRAGGIGSYRDEHLINDTRIIIQDSLRFLDVDVPDEEIEVRRMSFLPVLEELGINLYLLSYFLLFLITATTSVITRSPLIPSVKGKKLDIFTTGLWYIGMVFTFFFISILILGFYYDIFTKFYLIPGVIGSISMISGFTLNYLWYIKNGEKKVDAMGIHVDENNESCTYDREEPPKW